MNRTYYALDTAIFVILLLLFCGSAEAVVAEFTIQPAIASCGIMVEFNAELSQADAGQIIVKYEWDFDYDGVIFTVQDSGKVAYHQYTGPGSEGEHTVALRVTDDSDPVQTDIAQNIAELDFQNFQPTADAGGPYYSADLGDGPPTDVVLDGSASLDINQPCDGIVSYKWDTDGDGLFGSEDTDGGLCGGSECEGVEVTVVSGSWYVGQSIPISLRVIDSYGLASAVSETIIHIVDIDNMPPLIHEVVIDNFVRGNAYFDFSVSHPKESPQVFDCLFSVNGNPVTVYGEGDTLITQVGYAGSDSVQKFAGYFDSSSFACARDAYRLIVTVKTSNDIEDQLVGGLFTIDNTAPINPNSCIDSGSVSGELTSDPDPDFSWSGATDNISSLLTYYYYWGTNPAGESEGNATTNNGFNPDSLAEDGIFYLRVNTEDEAGNRAGWTELYIYNFEADSTAAYLENFRAAAGESGVLIEWRVSGSERVSKFILRRVAGNGGTFGVIATIETKRDRANYSYSDGEVGRGKLYRYRLYAAEEQTERMLFETGEIRTPGPEKLIITNHPNPFNPSTAIEYFLPIETGVVIKIYDPMGRKVRELLRCRQKEGKQRVEWNGHDDSGNPVSSGIYFCYLKAGKTSIFRKIVLMR